MASKIKETPVLYGKDAVNFNRTIKANESKKVPAADYNRAIEASRRIKWHYH